MIYENKKVGIKGQVVIPKIFRKVIGINSGTTVRIRLKRDKIIIDKTKIDPIKIFEEIAHKGKSLKEFNTNKNYEEMMEERWKKIKKST